MSTCRYMDDNGTKCIEYRLDRNPIRVELFSLMVHENLAIPISDIELSKNFNYISFRDFKNVNIGDLTDEIRYDVMCQLRNLLAFLEINGYQVVGIELEDVAILSNSNPDKDNHLLVHNLEVKRPFYFRPDNDYIIDLFAKQLGNSKVTGKLKPCRRMKKAYILKNSKYISSVKEFNS